MSELDIDRIDLGQSKCPTLYACCMFTVIRMCLRGSLTLSAQQNETKTKQFNNFLENVLFQFHFVVRTVSPVYQCVFKIICNRKSNCRLPKYMLQVRTNQLVPPTFVVVVVYIHRIKFSVLQTVKFISIYSLFKTQSRTNRHKIRLRI